MMDHYKTIRVCPVRSQITIDADLYPGSSYLGKRPRSNSNQDVAQLISSCDAEQTKLDEYLDTCAFVMHESLSDGNGILLRGSQILQEKALKLLQSYN